MRRRLHAFFLWLHRRPWSALAVYWLTAFVVTHIPPLRLRNPDAPPRLIPLDKIVHFGGFLALSWLLMNLLSRRLGVAWSILLTVLICALYGAFDELTQPPFDRTADVWDWIADMAGCGAGLLAWAISARKSISPDQPRHGVPLE